MNEVIPDRWVIVTIREEGRPPIQKILSGWWGGYLGSDEWRMSSTIISQTEHIDHFILDTKSGSRYLCYKNRKGYTNLSSNVLYNMQDKLPDNITIEVDE